MIDFTSSLPHYLQTEKYCPGIISLLILKRFKYSTSIHVQAYKDIDKLSFMSLPTCQKSRKHRYNEVIAKALYFHQNT